LAVARSDAATSPPVVHVAAAVEHGNISFV
jgi:hypothetical protein